MAGMDEGGRREGEFVVVGDDGEEMGTETLGKERRRGRNKMVLERA